MPLARANWKVLLPTWRGLAGAGWLSLARLASLGAAAASEAAAHRKAPARRTDLQPVKPAAALFFGGRRRALAAFIHFGIGINRPAGVGSGSGIEQLVGKTTIGILHRRALIGIQPRTNARIGG